MSDRPIQVKVVQGVSREAAKNLIEEEIQDAVLEGVKGDKGDKGDTGDTGAAGADGVDGINGTDGADGASAYDIWLSEGGTGTEADFLASLQGEDGAAGTNGADGQDGAQGVAGTNGQDGADGQDGASAYDIWIAEGNTGTEADFLASLEGADGADGQDGANGAAGADGAAGTNGTNGNDGDSAYDIWIAAGNTGTEADFLASLATPPSNNGGGWAYYEDDQYTEASPLIIVDGNSAQLTINAATSIETQLPVGYVSLWDSTTNRMRSKNVADTVQFSVRFKAKSSNNNGGISYALYIGAGQTIPILSDSRRFLRGSGVANDVVFQGTPYHLDTFLANGGAFYVTAEDGSLEIYDISIKLELNYRADIDIIYNLVADSGAPNNEDGRPNGTIYLEI